MIIAQNRWFSREGFRKLKVALSLFASLLFAAPALAEFTCELSFLQAPATALTNFPVLVRLAENAPIGFSYANCPNGGCIWFTDAENNDIPFEVDTWNTSGESLVWVSVPSLSSAASITMHWNAAGAPSGLPASSQVWSLAGYIGVWHMNEILEDGAGNHYTPDSSASGWHAYKANESNASYPQSVTTATGVTPNPTPLTGKAMNIAYGSGIHQATAAGFIVPASVTSSTTFNGPGFTFSAILNSQQIANDGRGRIIATGTTYSEMFNLTVGSDDIYCMGNNSYHSKQNPKGGTDWVYASAVFGRGSGNKSFIFADGVNLTGSAGGNPTGITSHTPTKGIGLGCYANGTYSLTGYLDETRIRNAPSSDEWVAEEYKTVTTANYVSFGGVQMSDELHFGKPNTIGIVGTTAKLAGRLINLGDGADEADIWLVYTDGSTTNMVSVGTVSTEPVNFTNTVSGLAYSTEYTCWFTAANNAVPAASTNSIALTFKTEPRERMLRYTTDMVLEYVKSATAADLPTAVGQLQDGAIQEMDVGKPFNINFVAQYHITKLVYAGRNASSAVSQRMRGVTFSSSADNTAFTTFHTVPNDFTQGSELVTNDLSSANVNGQFFVTQLGTGNGYISISELQFWTDSDAIILSTPIFSDETSSGATASISATLDGKFASGTTVGLKAYVATSDLGSNLADWQSGATEIDCGIVANGGEWVGTITSAAPGINYVRFYATAENVDHETASTFSYAAFTFNAINMSENRPLVESSASMLAHYPGTIAQVYKAFDNDDTTVPSSGSGYMGALDYGRPVRIDRVRIVTSGANSVGIPIQVSQDGWTWQTIASRASTDDLAVNIDLATPVVARYLRFGGDGKTQTTPQINEVRTYAISGTAFVAVANETARHTAAGLVLSGTIAGGNLAGGTSVSLYGYVGPQDYGVNKAAWDAAGITPTLVGQYQVGANFTTPALNGTANTTSGVRYGAVVAVATGAASSMGTAHPFTLNNETLLDITQEMVVTNYAGASKSTSAELIKLFNQGFWGNRSVITASGDNYSNGAVSFGGKQYRITMVEWHDRLEGGCLDRARAAKFRIYNSGDIIGSTDYTQIAEASSAWGASAPNTFTVHANRWNAVAPAEKAVGYGVGIYDAGNGNCFFRFWGYKDTARGLSIILR